MASERKQERRSVWRVGPESTWTTVLPVAFIIISLVSLAVLPIVGERRTSRLRGEVTKECEPARNTASALQIALSSELDKLIAYQVTRQAQYRDDYLRLLERHREAVKTLRRLSPRLSPEAGKALEVLIADSNQWHTAVDRGGFLTPIPTEVFATRLFERHPRYERVVRSADALETAIQNAIDDRYARIRDAERLNVTLTVVLTLLALTSALLVAGLGRQMRLLAREAMRRRRDAEREAADAKVARAAAEREERRAAFIAGAAQELTVSLDLEQTTQRFARLVVPNLAESCVIDLVEPGGGLRRAAAVHCERGRETAMAAHAGEKYEEPPQALAEILREREARLIGAPSPLIHYITGDTNAPPRSMLAVPLVSRGETIGVLLMTAPEGRVFTRDDAETAAQLARHGSLAVDNARLYQESQQAVRAREEVLAIVSHDLRNPLNAIMLGAQLLQMSEHVPPEDHEQVEAISVSARRMRALIDDLLDVTRLEGGKQLPVEPKPVEVETLFREAHELFKAQAAACSISIHQAIDEGVPRVRADRHRIMQVLSNLIGNALKFTPAGGVVSFRADRSNGSVLVTVADTGHGIPPENLGKIFNPYWQAKRTARLGAGLGLPIAKGIVESHGGRIWVESTPEVGTKFFFTLPIAQAGDDTGTGATRPEESAVRH